MDAFLTHQGQTNIGEIVHSVSATISTLFLFTRLWARTNKHAGLWWDDYFLIGSWAFLISGNGCQAALPSYGFRVLQGTEHGWTLMKSSASFIYIATGLGKTAFATTLLRLSSGGTRALLWCIIALVCAFSAAVSIVTWAAICRQTTDVVNISSTCVPQQVVIWIHTGNAIVTFCADFSLAYLPWRILNNVYLPRREKLATGLSMSLVGLAGIVCVVKVAILVRVADLQEREGEVDWTYGAIVVWILTQFEAAIYIIAQTVPLLRVLFSRSSSSSRLVKSVAEIDVNRTSKGKAPDRGAEGIINVPDAYQDIELVQLPSGRIVPADSQEGKAFKESQPTTDRATVASSPLESTEVAPAAETKPDPSAGVTVDDDVHRLWLSMGLSKRVWSKSPSPQREESSAGVLSNVASI